MQLFVQSKSNLTVFRGFFLCMLVVNGSSSPPLGFSSLLIPTPCLRVQSPTLNQGSADGMYDHEPCWYLNP